MRNDTHIVPILKQHFKLAPSLSPKMSYLFFLLNYFNLLYLKFLMVLLFFSEGGFLSLFKTFESFLVLHRGVMKPSESEHAFKHFFPQEF